MQRRPKYVCQSTTCRREIEIEIPSGQEGQGNPKCVCGSEMKKVYKPPTLTNLSKAEAMQILKKSDPTNLLRVKLA
jgi:hypothetical protein